jgi:predicted MPP superfamily phosphohydrolase
VTGYILGLAAAVLGGYSFFIERHAVSLTRLDLTFKRLPHAFDGFTVLQISDLHIGHWTRLEQRMEELVSDLKPDLLVLTGDNAVSGKGARLLREFLDRIRPNNETYLIYGNTENKREYGKRRREDLNWPGLRVLVNEHVLIEQEGEKIVLAGVDDPFTRHDDLNCALAGAPDDLFKLLLAHAPSIAGEARDAGVDLILSGHTHGGQIRFPLVGAVYPHLKKYRRLVMGLFEGDRLNRILKKDAGDMKVYVSRGVGISNLPLRFLCPPEIVYITLRSA